MKVKQLNKKQRKELETPAAELYNSLLFEDIAKANKRLKKINVKNTNNK